MKAGGKSGWGVISFSLLGLFVPAYLGYRVLFCYTLLPAANTGDLKHKEGAVYYFPRVWFNPFKKQELINRIDFFNQQILSQNDTSKTAIWWGRQIAEGNKEHSLFGYLVVCNLLWTI